ncbi:energy transducer TonB [Flavobacterium sp. I3-2]|uniref:energy transducer TonB n=1 Tax=Flavobacterium sp. I3-2 TaxID=2748319 RepID=UPI0015AD04D3|nr:energy transducer TonB [Flavobacterium sp. I3-2]
MKKILTLLLFSFYLFTYAQEDDNRIYFEVDQIATYQGGYANFNKYISDNINCKVKINKREKNQIQLRFIVEKNGEIKNVEILSEKPFVCSKEIGQAIKKCPYWKAARKNNLPVRSIVQMDVNFEK